MSIVDKVKELILKMNEKGLPVPLFRDPDKKGPSITFTFFYASGILALASLVGKFSKILGDVDVSGAIYLFISASAIYTGRKMTSDSSKKTVEISNKEEK